MEQYRRHHRVVVVHVGLTSHQVAVLANHAMYRGLFRGGPPGLSIKEQVQYVIDSWCADECSQDFADELREHDVVPLSFDRSALPSPD